jgi:3-hydroxymyristoyl/3-hydroxydecanoyl-(acyl carrier protein) dehydratase
MSAELPSLTRASPIKALDRVVSLDESGIHTQVAMKDYYFNGHYVDFPIFPGVFIVECANQASRVYADRFVGKVRLAEARTRFLSAVRPGDVLDIKIKAKRIDGGANLRMIATCEKDGIEASNVKLIFEIKGS